jgi:2-amino-4-hydroxy-6-hydroxymethyldihydropteridine diphosphokinase
MTRAYVGMGSNLGDRVAELRAALDALDANPGIRVAAVSSVYESEPWGVTDQPAFANAVAAVDVDLTPQDLLAVCKRLEAEAGRVEGVPNGPRPLDLDLLLYGDLTLDEPDLTIPHPRMLERDFVVTPLLEIAPEADLPNADHIARDAADRGRVVGILAPPMREPTGRPSRPPEV